MFSPRTALDKERETAGENKSGSASLCKSALPLPGFQPPPGALALSPLLCFCLSKLMSGGEVFYAT